MRISAFFLLMSICYMSCNVSPEPINYNQDECAYCKMKIADIKFGAELVTKKGKIYKYDSAECLFRTYLEKENREYAYVIVTDFSSPHNLIDAMDATFIISEKRPSPMGENLSAYSNKEMAESIAKDLDGKVYSFNEMLNVYKVE